MAVRADRLLRAAYVVSIAWKTFLRWRVPPKIRSNFWLEMHLAVINIYNSTLRRVAQPGSALAWGARGREFESRHADHLYQGLSFARG